MNGDPTVSPRWMRASVAPTTRAAIGDGLVAGALAGALSGLPSTAVAFVRRAHPLEAVAAAGTLLLAPDAGTGRLTVAGSVAHAALSLGWATVLALALPERHTLAAGLAGGSAIAALDLGLIGRRYPRIRRLPMGPQIADHLAFGAVVAAVVHRRHRRR